jgi:hypothetical protein
VNGKLLAAGAIFLLMSAAHTGIGVRWVLPRLREESLPRSPFGGGDMTAAMITVSWHAVGIMLLVFGVVLSIVAHTPLGDGGRVAVRGIGLGFIATTVLVLWLARRRPSNLLRAPMWLTFVAVAALCWSGTSG